MRRFLRAFLTAVVGLAALALTSGQARGATLRVPQNFATIQAAVNAASSGDEIRVGHGQWCGASIDKQLNLVGQGNATIVGCSSPSLFGFLRIGFFFDTAIGSPASGTTIRNCTFDGRGVSNTNLDPLAFAVFARDVKDMVVEGNTILGTVQAITNTRGSGWSVTHNKIVDLTVFTCDGFCGGGDAIVFQQRDPLLPRASGNSAQFNVITGSIPDSLNEFSMTGIFVIGQDGTVVTNNRIGIPDNPVAAGDGLGIEISDTCCGLGVTLLTSINSVILNNDGRGSELVLVVDVDANGGYGNSVGTTLRGNMGVNDINGSASTVRNRSVKTLITFP